MTSSQLLTIKKLTVSFASSNGIIEAVKKANLNINKGEILALVGESGSGKTVTGLSIPQLLPGNVIKLEGSIIFDGMELLKQPETILRNIRGKHISMIFQEPMASLNPLHTIEKQIGEMISQHYLLSKKEKRARIIELLNMAGLPEGESRLNAYPYNLSGGQRQRVMIAMALANSPDLLIADEPTTSLDVTIQAQILDLLKEIQVRTKMAILLITHNLSIVKKVADRVAVMRHGEIVEEGTTEKIFIRPWHIYTKQLIDAVPKGEPTTLDPKAVEIVRFDNISVKYPIKKGLMKRTVDCIQAVKDVSALIFEGQTLGVVGESGSGKTSLGMAILRLERFEGKAIFMGKGIHLLHEENMRRLRSRIQIVFQDPYGAFNPRMTVREIIDEGLRVHQPHMQTQERNELIVKTLIEVGLEKDMLDRLPHEFSGGQRQRIAIARALVLKPKFIVFDEPTSSLDSSVQVQMIDLFRDIQRKYKITYMFISHDLKVIQALSHYVLVMCQGEVIEQGPVGQIFKEPKEPYTKTLLAAALNVRALSDVHFVTG
ncbi:MAG: ABC transporter ATP-binding protein [Deltaproteobacteria bacterium]|nr:ABC transporter ATP-binding protein [Deltaproteobacteria bacterium]